MVKWIVVVDDAACAIKARTKRIKKKNLRAELFLFGCKRLSQSLAVPVMTFLDE